MSEELRLAVELAPRHEDVHYLYQRLTEFNDAHAGPMNHLQVAVYLRDGAGAIAGGLAGDLYWEWLHIDVLWIEERYRRQGHGKALVAAVEQEALHRGCHHAHVDTMDFQALPFYQKLGYAVYGELHDVPLGHTRYFLQKAL